MSSERKNWSPLSEKAQSPWCSFCPDNNHLERIPFLLWHCPVAQDYWKMVVRFLENFIPNTVLGEKEIIFGDVKSRPESVVNTVLAISKMFLWTQKFTSKRLDSIQYLKYLERELRSISNICKLKDFSLPDSKNWTQILNFFEIK